MRRIVARRACHQFESLRAMECPEDEQVRETFYVRESGLQIGPYFKNSLGLVLRAAAFGDLPSIVIGTSYKSDRLHREHVFRPIPSPSPTQTLTPASAKYCRIVLP